MKHASATVTYFSLDKDGKATARHIFHGVSWRLKTVSSAADRGAIVAKVIVCRLPLESVPTGFLAKETDMIVQGEITEDGLTDSVLKHTYGAATIRAVTDNRDGLAPHWKLEAV